MRIVVQVKVPKLALRFDPERTARQLAETMHKHWTANFLAGKQPDGSALPLNQEGRPLGVGGGSLVRGWSLRTLNKRKDQASVVVSPGRSGKRVEAIRAMSKRGVRFQGLDGVSGEKWVSAVERITKIMMASALGHQSKR